MCLLTDSRETTKEGVTVYRSKHGYSYELFEGLVHCHKHSGDIEGRFEIMHSKFGKYIVCPRCYSFLQESEYTFLKEYPVKPRI